MKKLLLLLLLVFGCEDTRVAEENPESIQMWVNGDIIPVYDYYESITTLGVKTLTDSGDVKKVFVIHFQKDAGRVSPEKEHYALILYDIDAINNDDLIDEGSYVNPASQSSFQFQTSTNSGSSYGVTVTSTYFRGQHTEQGSGGALGYQTTVDQAQTANDQILLHDQSADADSGGAGELYLFSPSSTTYVKHFYSRNVNFSPSSSYQAYIFDAYIGGYFNTTTAIDAIIFRCSTGNFDGTIKLYGISKS